MTHMPSFTESGSACSSSGCGPRIVEYVATGSEVPAGFTVLIGATLADAAYYPAFYGVLENGVIVPWAWVFPPSGRTTTQFEARFTGDGLTAGAVYLFQLVEA